MPILRRPALRAFAAAIDRAAKLRLAACAALVVVSAGFPIAGPLALKAAVDAVADRNAGAAALAVLAYAGLELGSRCMGTLLSMGYGGVWRRLQRGMARRVYAHVLDLPHAYHLASRTGELNSVLIRCSATSNCIGPTAANTGA